LSDGQRSSIMGSFHTTGSRSFDTTGSSDHSSASEHSMPPAIRRAGGGCQRLTAGGEPGCAITTTVTTT